MRYIEDFEIERALARAEVPFVSTGNREWRIGGGDLYLIVDDERHDAPPFAIVRKPFDYGKWLQQPSLSQGVESVEEGLTLTAGVKTCANLLRERVDAR